MEPQIDQAMPKVLQNLDGGPPRDRFWKREYIGKRRSAPKTPPKRLEVSFLMICAPFQDEFLNDFQWLSAPLLAFISGTRNATHIVESAKTKTTFKNLK